MSEDYATHEVKVGELKEVLRERVTGLEKEVADLKRKLNAKQQQINHLKDDVYQLEANPRFDLIQGRVAAMKKENAELEAVRQNPAGPKGPGNRVSILFQMVDARDQRIAYLEGRVAALGKENALSTTRRKGGSNANT